MTLQDHYVITTTRRTASLRATPAGASTARSSHAPAPPYHPAADTPRRRQIAQLNTGRPCASPSPSLHSTSASAWAAQARRLPQLAVCAKVNTCRRRASRYSAHRRRHRRAPTIRRNMPPDCRCLLGCSCTVSHAVIWARATRVNSPSKEIFAPHTRRPLLATRRNMHLYAASSPLYAAILTSRGWALRRLVMGASDSK